MADNSKDMQINETGKVGGDESKEQDWQRRDNTSPEMASVSASQNDDAYTIALIKTEMEKKLAEFRKTVVDEAVFAAQAGSRKAMDDVSSEGIEAIARVIRIDEKLKMMADIDELMKETTQLRTNFNAL